MSETRTEQPAVDPPKPEGPPPDPREREGTIADLDRLLRDVREIGARLFSDAADLVRAQWRLTSYVMANSARILVLRATALAVAGILGFAAWVLLNVAIWKAVAMCAAPPFLPPLALVALNGAAGLGLVLWQKNLRLK